MFAIDLNHPDVVAIQQHAKLAHYKKGTTILRSDDDTHYLHIVIGGLVKASFTNSRGEETISVIYGADDLFPLAWIIEQRRMPVDFVAMTDCDLALVPQDVFLEYMNKSVDVSNAVLRKILEQYTLFGTRIVNLEFKFARERLAYQLLVLAAKFGVKKNGALVIPHISQQDIGATINISRELVSREVSRLERQGIITYGNDGITIHDLTRLHHEVGKDTIIPFLDSKS